MKFVFHWLVRVLCVWSLLVCFSALAQENGGSIPTLVALEKAQEEAQGDASVGESVRQQVRDLYDQAIRSRMQVDESRAALNKISTLVAEGPERIEAIQREIANPAVGDPFPSEDATLNAIESNLEEAYAQLSNARETVRAKEEELGKLAVENKGLIGEVAERVSALERITADLSSPASTDSLLVRRAREVALKIRRELREVELESIRLRLSNQDLLVHLAQAERDLARARVDKIQPRVDRLQASVQSKREERALEASAAAETLSAQSADLPPRLVALAADVAALRAEAARVVTEENAVSGRLESVKLTLEELRAEFKRTRQKVDVVGSTEAIGRMLHKRRSALPSLQAYRRGSQERSAAIVEATDRQIDTDEALRDLMVTDEVVGVLLREIDSAQGEDFRSPAQRLVDEQSAALNALRQVYSRYGSQLTSLDVAERQLAEVAEDFTDYIDEQLIWIPSSSVKKLASSSNWAAALGWIISPEHWTGLATDLIRLLKERTLPSLLLISVVTMLYGARGRAREHLADLSKKTLKLRTDNYTLTLRAFWWTLVLILPLPLLLGGIGVGLQHDPEVTAFGNGLGAALGHSALLLLGILLLTRACEDKGLGDRHLRWNAGVRQRLLAELAWATPPFVFLMLVVTWTFDLANANDAQPLGRAAFVALMLVSAAFIRRVLRMNGGIMAYVRGGALAQSHFIWYVPLWLLLPAGLAIASILGYHYTAVRLQQHVNQTFWFFLGLFLIKEMILRFLTISERRLRFEAALRRRDELRLQREAKGDDDEPLPMPEVEELDFNGLSEQAKRLVQVSYLFAAVFGLWWIWAAILPAFDFLNQVTLPLSASETVDGVSKEVPVTLSDLVAAVILGAITVLAARNLPGLLEITLLQRLQLEPGARYAITTLSQYLIVGVGVIAGFSTIGLQWSSIQWLVAALGVGLGFGLQEIVANFISGIILLFERPIRVGDVVTVGETTGVVSKIKIRATTITNWDKQELLVPNKEFITGRLINWTLSDKLNRVTISVGVAYGTDVDKAMALMIEAAQESEHVLDDPKPLVSFDGFGDNALTLWLRAYLGNMDNRNSTITDLHRRINSKFEAAEISIAFPQRDLHITSVPSIEIQLIRPSR